MARYSKIALYKLRNDLRHEGNSNKPNHLLDHLGKKPIEPMGIPKPHFLEEIIDKQGEKLLSDHKTELDAAIKPSEKKVVKPKKKSAAKKKSRKTTEKKSSVKKNAKKMTSKKAKSTSKNSSKTSKKVTHKKTIKKVPAKKASKKIAVKKMAKKVLTAKSPKKNQEQYYYNEEEK